MPSARGIRVGRAFVELFADNSKLVRGLRRAEKRLKTFGDRIRNLGLKVAGLGTAMLGAAVSADRPFRGYWEGATNSQGFACRRAPWATNVSPAGAV